MTESRGVVGVTQVTRVGDDERRAFRLTADGAGINQDWEQSMVFEGRVFNASGGTITTPITFGAGDIDTTEPDFDLLVPSGTIVIPLAIEIYMEAYGSSLQFECMASVGRAGTQGTDTDVTPTNMRVDSSNASLCTVGVASNADAVYMTGNVSEFWRSGLQFAITKTSASATVASADPYKFAWYRKVSGVGPVLYSASQSTRLNVFAAGQAGTGFIKVQWVELPESAIG